MLRRIFLSSALMFSAVVGFSDPVKQIELTDINGQKFTVDQNELTRAFRELSHETGTIVPINDTQVAILNPRIYSGNEKLAFFKFDSPTAELICKMNGFSAQTAIKVATSDYSFPYDDIVTLRGSLETGIFISEILRPNSNLQIMTKIICRK